MAQWKHYIPRGHPQTIQSATPGEQFNGLIEEIHEKVICKLEGDDDKIGVEKTGPNTWKISFTEKSNSAAFDNEHPASDEGNPDPNAGATINLKIGTVETLSPGSDATAEIQGEPPDLTLNLGIPRGASGHDVQGVSFTVVTDIAKPVLVLEGAGLKVKQSFTTQTITLHDDGTWTKGEASTVERISDALGVVGCVNYNSGQS